MARTRLTVVLAIVGTIVAVPVAQATYAVIDSTAIGKAVEQIKELKAQLATQLEQLAQLKQSVSFLNDISEFVNDVSDAIGQITNITLPIPNIQKMAAQIRSDARCLMPDGVGWGIKTEDLNLGSICESSSKYREALILDEERLANMPFNEQDAARDLAKVHREALLADTAVRSLAQSDVAMKQADDLNKAADDLQSNLASAKTVQDRLHVQAQAQILQARAMASQSQLMAQMLKLTAAAEIKAGLSGEVVQEITEGKGKK
ncbi:MAG: hypothetical protein AB1918_09495 [Pseudomonadota bacterium]